MGCLEKYQFLSQTRREQKISTPHVDRYVRRDFLRVTQYRDENEILRGAPWPTNPK